MAEPSESTTSHAIAIAADLTPLRTIHTPPIISVPTPPPAPLPPSSPQLVDLVRCNHQKLWNCFVRKLKRYLRCFQSTESEDSNPKGGLESDIFVVVSSGAMQSPNCYSDMNLEERDEKLKSAIVYCKDSTTIQDDAQPGSEAP